MPRHAEPPSPRRPSDRGPGPAPAPPARGVDAVLFDVHGTLAQVEEPRVRVIAAAAECEVVLELGGATALADRLVAVAGQVGPCRTGCRRTSGARADGR